MTETAIARTSAFTALRDFARPRPAVERCELCAAVLTAGHEHLLDPRTRELRCACMACARLLGGTPGATLRLVRHRVQRLDEIGLTDAGWQALGLPIDLAFFVQSSVAGRVVALYPSPGGAIESSLDLSAWETLVAANPVLARLELDVEAVLVNRSRGRREHYLVSIEVCYRLVGLIRLHWRGFGGDPEVWRQIDQLFADLDGKSAA
jgi:hypothetical protein